MSEITLWMLESMISAAMELTLVNLMMMTICVESRRRETVSSSSVASRRRTVRSERKTSHVVPIGFGMLAQAFVSIANWSWVVRSESEPRSVVVTVVMIATLTGRAGGGGGDDGGEGGGDENDSRRPSPRPRPSDSPRIIKPATAVSTIAVTLLIRKQR